MLRPKRGIPFSSLMLLGALSGVVVLIYLNLTAPPPPATPTSLPSTPIAIVPTLDSPTPTPTLTPQPAFTPPIPADSIPANTRLLVPSAGVLADVVRAYLDGESWNIDNLGENVGHLQGTSWVSERGNIVLSGHVELSDGRGGVFSKLNQVKVGDFIGLEVNGITYVYGVTDIHTTTPDDLSPIYPTSKPTITLITCGAYDFIQDSYLERLIVVAELIQ